MRNRITCLGHFMLGLPALALALGCEDGPKQVFFPLRTDPQAQNGLQNSPKPFVAGTSKGFGDTAAADEVGSAKFCAETEESALAQQMVVQPLIPDVSAGGLPLWAPDGSAVKADALLGTIADGKFCNPTGTYGNAFTWGPTNDVILLFDQDTHLVQGVEVTQQYLGALTGNFTAADGSVVDVTAQPRERLSIAGQELDVYASRAQAQSEPNSWLNSANITKLYRMVRQTFFGAEPFPDDFDCVAAQICDVIYTGANEDTPQATQVALQDSGIQLGFTPEGYMSFLLLTPVRSAPFENGGTIAFGAQAGTQMAFGFQSQFRSDCALDLDSAFSWQDFQKRCIASGDERALDRATYAVDTARDAVDVEFNGVNLHFLHDVETLPLLGNGERPGPDDTLNSISFTRIMPAAVAEFRPLTLGTLYKTKLEQRLKASVSSPAPAATPPPGPPAPAAPNPIAAYALSVPFTLDTPQRIGELDTPDGSSWLPSVIADVASVYASLSAEQKAVVSPKVLDPVYLIEPFVDAVLFAFSYGESERAGAIKAFRTTDDGRWSIGYASFRRAGVPYRLTVQYSLNFGAVTSVEVSRGDSAIDRAIEASRSDATAPYFDASQMAQGTLLSLGSNALSIGEVDRQLGTILVTLNGLPTPAVLQLPGGAIEDLRGYQKQIRGERYDFVPANVLGWYGQDTQLLVWVQADGTIGKVENDNFKGTLELCPGLPIAYGDDVQAALLAWQGSVSLDEYSACDLVFNYSENGNVLGDITSLGYQQSISVIDGRAMNASVWK